jgi:hypothetical protein
MSAAHCRPVDRKKSGVGAESVPATNGIDRQLAAQAPCWILLVWDLDRFRSDESYAFKAFHVDGPSIE